MKKFISLLLSLVMICSLSFSVFGLTVTPLNPEDVFSKELIEQEKLEAEQRKEQSENYILSFSDVQPSRWSYNSIMEMTGMGLFSGTTKPINGIGTFAPTNIMSRAQFITVITRHLFNNELSEMDPGSIWYAPNWSIAVEKGIVNAGDFGGLDGLNEKISREEMAYIMANVLEYNGEKVEKLVDTSVISDFNTVNSVYSNDVLTCYSLGILTGYGDGNFGPKDSVTREQGAVILHRLIDSEVRVVVDSSKYKPIIDVKDNLDVVKQYSYEDYNDKIVTGEMVRAAIQNYKGKSTAILINTVSMANGGVTHNKHPFIHYLHATDMTSKTNINARMIETTGDKPLNTNSKYGHFYINYNALLELDNSTSVISFKDGVYDAKSVLFAADEKTGKILFDNFTDGIFTEGNGEYVNPSAKFSANLMKDDFGLVIGILFTELSE